MYQEYDEVTAAIERQLQSEGRSISYVLTFRRSARECREYLEDAGEPYSPQLVAKWLQTQAARLSHPMYSQLRTAQWRIALGMGRTDVPKESLYPDPQSNLDRLPGWARQSVEAFLTERIGRKQCIAGYKAGASTFLYILIQDGLKTLSAISCSMVADYHMRHGTVKGVDQYLQFLKERNTIGPFVAETYRHRDSKAIIGLKVCCPELGGEVHDVTEYHRASLIMMQDLHTNGYSAVICTDFKQAVDGLGIFLTVNGMGYSRRLVDAYIKEYRRGMPTKLPGLRRALLMMGDYLEGRESHDIPIAYRKKARTAPLWAEPYFSAYIGKRERNGLAKSTITMDRSSICRFFRFLESHGCCSFPALDARLIKAFHLEDRHRTGAGKNAYNARIRAFLRYLACEGVVDSNLAEALPKARDVRVRPATVLADDQITRLLEFCTQAENEGDLLSAAILRIAILTGLRAIDISLLTFDSIDWDRMEFSLVQQKTRTHIRVPFSIVIGNTIWRYLDEMRPDVGGPYVFISRFAPHRRLSTTQIRGIIERALGQGYGSSQLLRRTFATRLLRTGASVSLITDALGHASQRTIDPYLSTNDGMMGHCPIPLASCCPYGGGLL